MRIALGMCALAVLGSAASAQQFPVTGPAPATSGAVTRNPLPARAPQAADSLHLTRQQAITEALADNPLLEVARQQTAQAFARHVEVTALADPVFDAEWDNQQHFLYGSQSIPVSLGLTITDPLKLRRAGFVEDADIHNNQQNLRLQQQVIAVQTSQAYDALLAAVQHQKDLSGALTAARDFLTKTRAQFLAGVARGLDTLNANVAVVTQEIALKANVGATATAQASLNHLLGRQKTAPIMTVDTLTLPSALPDSSTIEQMALANRAEVAEALIQQQGASANTALIKSFWLPDFNVSIGKDYTMTGTPLLSTAITFPIPFYYRNHAKGDIAEAQHHELELAATTRDTRAAVVQDVRTSYAAAANAIDLAVLDRDQLIPAARQQYTVSLAAYQAGGISAFEVIQAQQALIAAESSYTNDVAAALSARADLERALGNPTDRLGAIAP